MGRRFKIEGLVWPALACLVTAFLCLQAWRYGGFVGLLGEWQFDDIEIYFPGLTVLALSLIFVIPAVLIILVMRYRERRRAQKGNDAVVLPRDQQFGRAIAVTTAIIYGMNLIASVSLVALLVSVAIPFLRDAGGGAADFVDGAERVDTTTLLAHLDGRVDTRHIAILRRGLGFIQHDVFVAPVTMRGQVPARGSRRFFAEVSPELGPNGAASQKMPNGYLRHAGFPKQLVALYQSVGIEVAPDALMLFSTKQSRDWPYYIVAIQFFCLASLAFVLGLVFRWRRRLLSRRLQAAATGAVG